MSVQHKTIAGIVGICIVFSIAIFVWCCGKNNPVPPFPKVDATQYVARFVEGLRKANDSDEETQEYGKALLQNAFSKIVEYPEMVRKVWKYQESDMSTAPPQQRLMILDTFIEQLDAALEGCDTPERFHTVWTIRRDIRQKRDEALRDVCKELKEKVDNISETDMVTISMMLAEYAESETVRDDKPVATTPAMLSMQELRTVVGEAGKRKIVEVHQQIDQLKEAVKKEKRQDQDDNGVNAYDPSYDETEKTWREGPYHKVMASIISLSERVDSPALTFWGEYATPTPDSRDVVSELVDLASQVESLQRIRYNLWVNRKLFSVVNSTPENAVRVLSQIDTGLLLPIVYGRYSADEQKFLDRITNPAMLMAAIRASLLADKVKLDAF